MFPPAQSFNYTSGLPHSQAGPETAQQGISRRFRHAATAVKGNGKGVSAAALQRVMKKAGGGAGRRPEAKASLI
jgi:hypothetical protein